MSDSTQNTQKTEATSLSGRVGRGADQEVGRRAVTEKGFELIKQSPHIPPFPAFATLIGCCCVHSSFNSQPTAKDRMQMECLAELP